MTNLGELERSIMDLLWATSGSLTANDARDALAQSSGVDGKELAVTTVLTVLSRLEKKGFVSRERHVRPHRYRAIQSREEHTADLMSQAFDRAVDREAVLARFLGTMSSDDAEALRRLLHQESA